MALALDASTPAVVTGTFTQAANTTYTVTTASFTPPANSVLVVVLCSNSGGTSQVLSNFAATDNLGAPLTYTQFIQKGNLSNDAQVTCWWAAVSTSAAMTVSASYKDAGGETGTPIMLRVLVLTGANTTSPIGATAGARGRTTNVSTSYSSTVDGSWGWLGYTDWTQSGVPTVPSSTEAVDSSDNVAGQDTYALIKQKATTATAGTTVTMSTTTPSSGLQVSWASFEIVPPSGGGTANHFLSLLGCGS